MPIFVTLLAATAALAAMSEPPKIEVQPFSLSDVHLLDGPFHDANVVCVKYLLTVDPDRLLHSFRVNADLPPKGDIYGGWEDSGLAGHSLGHYLSACSQEYASTKDPRFKQKIDYIVDELEVCQQHRKDGYIGAIPKADPAWAAVSRGEIKTGGFDLNGMWSPWYTVHKIMAGLVDSYRMAGNKKALVVAEKFADWAIDLTKNLTDQQWQKMLACEYGGMNDVLAEIYQIDKKPQYLELSHKFYDNRMLDPLADGVDSLPGKHSNTQIPKVIGLARLYELTGDERDRKIAEFFWDTVVHHHSYVIGGNSNHEYMGPADKLNNELSSNTCETCNTYNMLKLTRYLFEWDPKPEYADFYERAHLNDILASQNPATGMMCYFVPLVTGGHRTYSDPYDTWTCCHGTGMENHTKHDDSVYFHQGKQRLYVNLFMPTELQWHDAGITLRQTTKFPDDGHVELTIESGSATFDLAIRHPGWAKEPVEVLVNGKPALKSDEPSSYMVLNRHWKKGDKVEFTFPLSLHTEPMPDNPQRVSVLAGPVVLAADLGPSTGPEPRTPVLVTNERPVSEWLKPTEGKPLEFTTSQIARPADLTLRPFYEMHDQRYAVYFDEFTEEGWQKLEADYRAEEARQKDLEARTIDFMRVGEMQPERDHNLTSEKNDVREANGRSFRTPLNGGWCEFDLKVDAAGANDLVLTYWGNDRIHSDFSIQVNGTVIATETLLDKKSNQFFDKTYPIPQSLTSTKDHVRIRIQAAESRAAASISGARTVKRKD